MKKRKVIQIATCGVANTSWTQCDQSIIALCNDGTMWEIGGSRSWVQLPDLPQPTLPEGHWVGNVPPQKAP